MLFLSQAANAEIKIGKGSLTFNASVASQYIARGVDQNKDSVTPSVGADLTYPSASFGGSKKWCLFMRRFFDKWLVDSPLYV